MSNDTLLHYKKIYNKYYLDIYHDSVPVDYHKQRANNAFYSGTIPKNGYWIGKEQKNINEEVYLQNYGSKEVGVSSISFTVVIEEKGDKVSLKTYLTNKRRSVGSSYFRFDKTLNYITYNTKTKNLYVGSIKKKKVKVVSNKIKVNGFNEHSITQQRLLIRRMIRDLKYNPVNYSDDLFGSIVIESNHGNEESFEVFKVFFNILSKKTNIDLNYDSNDLDKEMFRMYLEHNGFKYPDTYGEYNNLSLPKNKLRKYGNVVTLIMSELNLRGRRVREILNQLKELNLMYLYDMYRMLGVDYFNKLEDHVFVTSESPSYYIRLEQIKSRSHNFNSLLNNSDRRRIVNLLNEKTRFSLILDHLQMIKKLKEYSHEFKMKFHDRDSFDQEHYELTELYDSYRKGTVKRSYGDYFKEKVEDIIMGPDGIDYYPILLLDSKDYNAESQHQSNCVRTYIENSSCVILSLREGSPEGNERATIEYRFRRNEMVRVQSLGKYNKTLSPRYDIPMEILDERMRYLYKKDILHLPMMIKEFKNGHKIKRKAHFQDFVKGKSFNESPVWDNNEEIKDYFFDFDLF